MRSSRLGRSGEKVARIGGTSGSLKHAAGHKKVYSAWVVAYHQWEVICQVTSKGFSMWIWYDLVSESVCTEKIEPLSCSLKQLGLCDFTTFEQFWILFAAYFGDPPTPPAPRLWQIDVEHQRSPGHAGHVNRRRVCPRTKMAYFHPRIQTIFLKLSLPKNHCFT